jgi:hypothetical protein
VSARGLRVALGMAVAAVLLIPAAGQAAGGTDIASAPLLPLDGSLQSGGGKTGEFWRLQAIAGDAIKIDMELSGGQYNAQLFVIDPAVTDYTLRQTPPTLDAEAAIGKSESVLRIPATGLWTLDICQQDIGRYCTKFDGDYFGAAAAPFTFTATVAHVTTMTLKAPAVATRGARITVTARIQSPAGEPRGTCVIAGRAAAVEAGVCHLRLRLGRGPRKILSASFVPDDGWQKSSSRRTVRLVRR